jgi:hypothetical protein
MNLPKAEIQALRALRKAKRHTAKVAPITIKGAVSWTNGTMAPGRYYGVKMDATEMMHHAAAMTFAVKTRINNGRAMQ